MERNASNPPFFHRLDAFGERAAIVTRDGAQLTYRELTEKADAIGHAIGSTRKLVLIEAANEPEPLIAYLGALRAGHPAILSAPGAFDKDGRVGDAFAPDVVYRQVDGQWRLERNPTERSTPLHGELAVLLSTSGTTGSAKLVRLSRRNIDANAGAIVAYLSLTKDDRGITSLPWHYSYGLSVVHSHLAAGGTLLLTDESVVEPGFWTFFEQHGGTNLAGVPHTFELLERTGFRDIPLNGLRLLTVAGGRLSPDRVAAFAKWARDRAIAFFVMYGQTEASPRMAYLPPELAADHPDHIGRPIPGGTMRLVDEGGVEIRDVGTVGELVYSGPNVMMGYATQRTDLARGHEVNELSTGDLAVRNTLGLYRIVGRTSRFSKLFGLRISLDEIETFLDRRGIRAAVAGDDRRIAVSTLDESAAAAIPGLLAAQFGLPPSAFAVTAVQEYPLLATGKIDYRTILSDAVQRSERSGPASARAVGDPADDLAAPAPMRPAALEDVFCWTLGRASVSGNDTFVSLGGDSLSFIQVSLAIEERLGFLPTGWEELTIAELEHLASSGQRSAAPASSHAASSALETEILLRVLACLGVVFTHATMLDVGGGASLLLVLAGYSFARFQRSKLFSGNAIGAVTPFLVNVAAPYYAMVVAYEALRGGYDLPQLLFVSNFQGRLSGFLQIYWFIELLLQCLVIFSGLFLVPPFRRLVAASPWRWGVALLAIAIATRAASSYAFDRHALDDRVPDMMIYMFAFGWCLFFAKSVRQRLVMSALTLAVFPFAVLHESEAVWLVLGTGLMIWMPSVTLIGPARAAVATVGSAAFFIYMTHLVNIHILHHVLDWGTGPAVVILALAMSLTTGVFTSWGYRRLVLFFARVFAHGKRAVLAPDPA